MSAIRCPKIAEMREGPFVGPLIADMLEALGIEDSDLPDIIADDVDYADPELLARDFPKLVAKIEGLDGPL